MVCKVIVDECESLFFRVTNGSVERIEAGTRTPMACLCLDAEVEVAGYRLRLVSAGNAARWYVANGFPSPTAVNTEFAQHLLLGSTVLPGDFYRIIDDPN